MIYMNHIYDVYVINMKYSYRRPEIHTMPMLPQPSERVTECILKPTVRQQRTIKANRRYKE